MAVADEDRYFLERPSGERESLNVEALGPNVSGLIVRRPLEAGLYTIRKDSAERQDSSSALRAPHSALPSDTVLQLAVQAPTSESELDALSPWKLQDTLGPSGIRMLGVDEPLRLEGGLRRGQSLWKWCAGAMLAVLLLEMTVLAAPRFQREAA